MIEVHQLGADVAAFAQELALRVGLEAAHAILRCAQEAQGELSQAVMETLTKRPSGALARSFEVSFEESEGQISAGAFSRLPYATIQDAGGEIHASKTKYLAIPLDGVPRGVRPREYGKALVFLRSKSGAGGVLAEPLGKGRMRPRYALKRSVRIEGVGYVALAQERLQPLVAEIMDTAMGLSVRAAEEKA